MASDWVTTARDRLLCLRDPRLTAWGYRAGAAPCVEPTVLACLGLLATDPAPGRDFDSASHLPIARRAAGWLATLQNQDGSLGVSSALRAPVWSTPYAIVLWAALGQNRAEVKRATQWLLCERVHTMPRESNPWTGHDTSIAGWPWVPETHPWLEPTALALLALRCAGSPDRVRAHEGLRLIRDRAIATGGWNFGSRSVLGCDLRPQPAPTGLALVALVGVDDRTAAVERAIAYLLRTLPETRSAQALGWGLLGLRAWNAWPGEAEQWLAETSRRILSRADAAPRLAYLLLATGDHTPDLLGTPKKGNRHDG
jgi:hypothetical protein